MLTETIMQITNLLLDVPEKSLKIIHNSYAGSEIDLFTDSFQAITEGKGKIIVYQVFPGIQLSLNTYLASQISFRHGSQPYIMEVNYCHKGRIGWDFKNGTSAYLGTGDLSLHSASCCAYSAMQFPLGYCESISLSINLDELCRHPLPLLEEATINLKQLKKNFCQIDKSIELPSCPEIERIFHPLYNLPENLRIPYFKLKIQELFLYLSQLNPEEDRVAPYYSKQVALIKEIHAYLTEHLDERFTIEDLAKKYLINMTSLKEIFKGVYGLPIATYMNQYRMQKGMELLRTTDDSISEIAAKLGYETQGKFSKAFKNYVNMTPSHYRQNSTYS